MKEFVQNIIASPNFAKAREWGKLITITGSAQIIIQAIGFACGILIIRLLPTDEYALYTLANTMLGTMIVLADGGITNSVMAQGGKVWTDRKKLGNVLVTGYDLRKKFAIGSLIIAIPALLYLLRHHNASWLMSFLIIISIVPVFFTTLSGSLLAIGPILHQSITPLKKVEIVANTGRLVLLVILLFVFPWAYIALFVAGIPQIWANLRIRKISSRFVDWSQNKNVEVRKNILSFVKRIMPGSIYYSISGQMTIWLISIFGSTSAVAQIGALGRLSMILSLFSVLFGTLIIPRFARLPDVKEVIFKKFIQIQFGLIILFSFIVFIVSMFPEQLLWILGKNYSGLEKELILSVAGSCLGLMAGLLFTIASCRNWAINPMISIPITTGAIICGILLIDISTLSGILKFNIFISSIEVIIYSVYSVSKIRKVGLNIVNNDV